MQTIELLFHIKAKERGERFSANLFKWCRKHRGVNLFVAFSSVSCFDETKECFFEYGYTMPEQLYIGFGDLDDGWLHGARLTDIICNGTKANEFAFPPDREFTIIDDWWNQYVSAGKCCIDPEHILYDDRERWEQQGKSRTCVWCGDFEQELTIKYEPREIWMKKIKSGATN